MNFSLASRSHQFRQLNCYGYCNVCFLVSNPAFTFPTVEQCKLGIVKFIEAEQVPELEAVIHLVVASSDTRHSVATAADLELKSKQRYEFGCLEKMVLVFLTKLAAVNVVLQRDCAPKGGSLQSLAYLQSCTVFAAGWEWCGSRSCSWEHHLAPELTALAVCVQSSLVLLLSHLFIPWFPDCPLLIINGQ